MKRYVSNLGDGQGSYTQEANTWSVFFPPNMLVENRPTCVDSMNGKLWYKGKGKLSEVSNPALINGWVQKYGLKPENDQVFVGYLNGTIKGWYVFQTGSRNWYYITACTDATTSGMAHAIGNSTQDAQRDGLPPCVTVVNGVMLYTGKGTLYPVTAPDNRLTVNSTLFNNRLIDTQVVVLDLGTAREAWYVYLQGRWYYIANCNIYNSPGGMEKAKAMLPCITFKNGKFYYSGTGLSDMLPRDYIAYSVAGKPARAYSDTNREEFEAVPYNTGTDQEFWLIWRSGKWYKMIKCGDVYPAIAEKKKLPDAPIDPVVKIDPLIGTGQNPIITMPIETKPRIEPIGSNPGQGAGTISIPKLTLPPCIKLVNGSYVYEPNILNAAPGVGKYPVSTINSSPNYSNAPNPFLAAGIPLNDLAGNITGVGMGAVGIGAVGSATEGMQEAVSASTPARVVNQGTANEVWYALIDGEWVKLIACKPEIKVVGQPDPIYPSPVVRQPDPIYPSPVVRQPDPIYPSPVVRQPDPIYPSPVVRQPDPIYPSPVVRQPDPIPQPQEPDDCDCEVKKLSMPKMVIYDYPKKDNCCNGEFY